MPHPFASPTKHGYALDEVVSALQKSIRRADADAAMFWAVELNESGYGAYCWRRLMIIAAEDVGLADPFAAVLVHALHGNSLVHWQNMRGDRETKSRARWDGLSLLEAVAYLARCAKNRETADAYSVIERRMALGELLDIPDVALDVHTRRGRSMGRDERHFQQQGRRIALYRPIDGDPWAARFLAEVSKGDE
jgi:replication-associated recombination protein RarA